MKKNLGIKTAIIIATLLVFLYGIFGIPKGLSGESLKAALLQRIHLGLDLKGGTHLILQVVVKEAVNFKTQDAIGRLEDELKAKNIPYAQITTPPDQVDKIIIKGVPTDQASAVRTFAGDQLVDFVASSQENDIILTMKPSLVREVESKAVTQSIETIRSRVDTLGVSEPVIQEHGLGEHQILVQLPGVDDPARVKDIIQSTAMLEIKQSFGEYATEQEAMQNAGPDRVVLKGGAGSRNPNSFYVLSRRSVVGGLDVRDASMTRDENGRPAVTFNLTKSAGDKFAAFTGANVGNQLAIVLDNKVRENANIQEQIRDQVRISGAFTEEAAKDLALVLRSGALPASIRYLEDRPVSASLGADSVRAGVTAAIVGLVAVMVFMLVYYRGAGINANLGLILNLVVLLGFLGFSGAALTLPGIAGVILTIGMGVDSNVLIFERIREELRHGKMPGTAVEQGFARAWVTIIDTHVTTIVSALILFLFGSGPVRGFAITLAFGLLANLFTSVFVSRVIFDAILNRHQRGEALSI
ncbi:MAG TPA: protein translocase subunit SecD [Terriglobales bacterium]|nr:protein translocase subunit SecD [Terriglobales bacterium]